MHDGARRRDLENADLGARLVRPRDQSEYQEREESGRTTSHWDLHVGSV
jgi:hypothetical protein